MNELSRYGTRAETVFVLPTDENTFLSWLTARATREAGIGVIPSLKHYHHSHLDTSVLQGVAGSKELAIRRWHMMRERGWICIPYVRVNVIPLSDRKHNAQCEVWIARLLQESASGEELYEDGANTEYDRLVVDVQVRWPNTVVSSKDYRVPENRSDNGHSPTKTLGVTGRIDSSYRQKLRRWLEEHFNEEEVRTLCFDLGTDYDSLSGDSKSGKIRELLAHSERHHKLNDLLIILREERPSITKDLER